MYVYSNKFDLGLWSGKNSSLYLIWNRWTVEFNLGWINKK